MKNKKHAWILLTLFFLLVHFKGQSQIDNSDVQKISKGAFAKNLESAYYSMMKNAKFIPMKNDKPCNPKDLIDKLSSTKKNIVAASWSYAIFAPVMDNRIQELTVQNFDKGTFKTIEDRALNAFNSSDNFGDFVISLTGKAVKDIKGERVNKNDESYKDIDILRVIYKYFEDFFDKEHQVFARDPFTDNDCQIDMVSKISVKKFDYPNIEYVIRTEVKIDCDCDLSNFDSEIKGGFFEYEANVSGLLTNAAITFSEPKNPIVKVLKLDCCPVKEEESKMTLNDLDKDKGYFQVGAHVGLPLGKEKDFYSFTYGVEASYVFNISDYFSAGGGVGYTRFTGKDIGGFETEGVGFIPIKGLGSYNLTDDFDLHVYGGYSISTVEGLDGGLNYGVGLGWRPVPGLIIRPEISLTSLGENGDFNEFRLRVYRTF